MLTTAVLTELAAHPGYGWGGGGGFSWLFLLIPLFWIIVVIALFAIFGRRWRRGWNGPYPYGHGPYGQGQADSRSAEKTLAERFAQGDIDEVEYRARLEVLRANRPAEPPAR